MPAGNIRALAVSAAIAAVVVVIGTSSGAPAATATYHRPPRLTGHAGSGIHKIKHVVIIMQENRSFDSYFGTYPGADGIPGLAGNPGKVPCIPDPHRPRLPEALPQSPGHQRRGSPHDGRCQG